MRSMYLRNLSVEKWVRKSVKNILWLPMFGWGLLAWKVRNRECVKVGEESWLRLRGHFIISLKLFAYLNSQGYFSLDLVSTR